MEIIGKYQVARIVRICNELNMGVRKREEAKIIWTAQSVMVKMTEIMNNREKMSKERGIHLWMC